MGKKLILFFLIVVLCFLATESSAKNFAGKILDIFGDNITTIQFEEKTGFSVGDSISVSYMAGTLPMILGTYEVTSVRDKVVLAKPTYISMEANVEMRVDAFLLQEKASSRKKERKQAPAKIQAVSNVRSAAEEISPRTESPYMEIRGEVLDVMGDDIKVAVKDNGTPRPGWKVDLFYVTSQGKELPVGEWKVKSVEGQVAVAEKVKGIGNARKGLKAVMHTGKKKKPAENNVSPGPGGAGSVGELMTEPGVFKDVQANTPPSIQLLGQTAPFDSSPGGQMIRENSEEWKNAEFNGFKQELERIATYSDTITEKELKIQGISRNYWLGVEITKNTHVIGQAFATAPMGLRVLKVMKDSPAVGKLEIADIIYEANGVKVSEVKPFIFILNTTKKGKLKLKIQRNYKLVEETIKLKRVK